MKIEEFSFFQALKKLSFVEKIILYGSRARGDFRERSDIDLAIVSPQATPEDWLRVIDIVNEADTLLKIDCVRLEELSNTNPLRKSILNQGIVIYKKESLDVP